MMRFARWRITRSVCSLMIGIGVGACGIVVSADPPDPERAIASGEFAIAKMLVSGASAKSGSGSQVNAINGAERRDRWLGQVAQSQHRLGDAEGALATLSQIDSPQVRRSVASEGNVFLGESGPKFGGGPGNPNSAAGGGAFADFDSLMQLIQTTVVPDTWEALGGNSTMAPYPQGIYVDPRGTVSVVTRSQAGADFGRNRGDGDHGELANLKSRLSQSPRHVTADWRSPSTMRCVSLRRLRDTISRRRLLGQELGEVVLHLAGLSRAEYVVLTEDDIIVASRVGGIDDVGGWLVDRQTGMVTMRSDFLARCLKSTLSDLPFGCTIDPTAEGLQAAMRMADEIQGGLRPIATSADSMASALGMQRVEVFGAPGNNAAALLMVEADRHMKQLALGKHPMPEGAMNYLDAVDRLIADGPPKDLLLRLWFTADPMRVRCDHDRQVFELSGTPIKLSRENQQALATGQRGDVIADPRSQLFVEDFNRNWTRLRDQYQLYGALESLYHAAAVSQLIRQYGTLPIHRHLAESLAAEDESDDWNLHPPQEVASIATRHTVRHGKQRHQIILASGGVFVESKSLLEADAVTYATLGDQHDHLALPPVQDDRWWWDLR
ncbi:DUF1598 domain-containing protein [Roseiconus lacunae]|uniref:DUF1598 domain-containing protein n=1 Tax=Roseiconus lacunae TaxID=2605694 RepID=UPI00135B0938|nr:DUF1598 domain-containing protein [Roseiconus lacunae]